MWHTRAFRQKCPLGICGTVIFIRKQGIQQSYGSFQRKNGTHTAVKYATIVFWCRFGFGRILSNSMQSRDSLQIFRRIRCRVLDDQRVSLVIINEYFHKVCDYRAWPQESRRCLATRRSCDLAASQAWAIDSSSRGQSLNATLIASENPPRWRRLRRSESRIRSILSCSLS